jgi:hypothetical protein
MVKYVNETETQIKQKHIDWYDLPGSQTNIVSPSVYPAIVIVRCHLSIWGKVALTKGMDI